MFLRLSTSVFVCVICTCLHLYASGKGTGSSTSGKEEATHPASAKSSQSLYRVMDKPLPELLEEFSSIETPVVSSADALLAQQRLSIPQLVKGGVGKRKEDIIRQYMIAEYERVIDIYKEAQIYLQNIYNNMHSSDSQSIVREQNGFHQRIDLLKNGLLRFVYDTIWTTHARRSVGPKAALVLDSYLHHAASITSLCAEGLPPRQAQRYNKAAYDLFRVSMFDLNAECLRDPEGLKPHLVGCRPEVVNGMHVFKTTSAHEPITKIFRDQVEEARHLRIPGKVAIIQGDTPIGHIMKRIPAKKHRKSSFGFLTLLNLAGFPRAESKQIIRHVSEFLTIVDGEGLRARYTFIIPCRDEVSAFRPILILLQELYPEIKEEINLILQYFRKENLVRKIKSKSKKLSLRDAPKVWEAIASAHRDYFLLVGQVTMTPELHRTFQYPQVAKLFTRANELCAAMSNYTGSVYMVQYTELKTISLQLGEILQSINLALNPPKDDVSVAEKASVEPFEHSEPQQEHYFYTPPIQGALNKEALNNARMAEAVRLRKAAAKLARNHRIDSRRARASASPQSASLVEKSQPYKLAKRSRKQKTRPKAIQNLASVEALGSHKTRVDALVAKLRAADTFSDLRDMCVEGDNLEFLEQFGCWSLRVNKSYRLVFWITKINGEDQMDPLRVGNLKFTKHYKGL